MPVKGRGAHEGTIRQRKPGLWEARIRNGNERESIYGKTEQEVIEKLLEARNAVSEGGPLPNRRMTVAKLIHDWLESKRPPATAPKTWRGYEEKCRNHVVPAWGTTKARELRPGRIESYLNQKVSDGHLSPMSARHIRGILRAALNWAMAEGHGAETWRRWRRRPRFRGGTRSRSRQRKWPRFSARSRAIGWKRSM